MSKQGRRSGRKAGKSGLDSLDADLGDLLGADDTPAPAKKTSSTRKSGGKKKKSDDDFYSMLQEQAENDDDVEVSDADPNEMLATFKMDDLDAELFGSPKKTIQKSSETVPSKSQSTHSHKVGQENEIDKLNRTYTVDDDQLKKVTKPETKKEDKKIVKKYDFGDFDEDDPLAGLLSDDEDTKATTKKARVKRTRTPPKVSSPEPEPVTTVKSPRERPRTRSGSDDKPESKYDKAARLSSPPTKQDDGGSWDSSKSSPKHVPAVREESKGKGRKATVKKDDITFDDDDVLGGMGLDDSPRKDKVKKKSLDEEEAKPAKSIMDSLLGKGAVDKLIERPSTGQNKKEFKLDEKYTKKTKEPTSPKKKEDDDFTFGDYVPSSATGRPSTSSSLRRSVRFEDDDDWLGLGSSKARSKSADTRRGRTTEASDDWLDMATGATPAKKDVKPKSKPTDDWLGSADTTPKKVDDWLGLSDSGSQESSKKSKHESDWLNISDQSPSKKIPDTSDWLGISEEKPSKFEKGITPVKKPTEKYSPRSTTDWLDIRTEDDVKKPADTTAPASPRRRPRWENESPPKREVTQAEEHDDYLGLGDDNSSSLKKPAIEMTKTEQKNLDLFVAPKSETHSVLPWETSSKPSHKAPEAKLQTETSMGQSSLSIETPPLMTSTMLSQTYPSQASSDTTAAYVEQMQLMRRQEEEQLRKLQEEAARQQQKQVEMQTAALEIQAKEMQRRQQEVMQQQMQEQQRRMEQETLRLQQQASMSFSSPIGLSYNQPTLAPALDHLAHTQLVQEYEIKIKKLESERDYLQDMIEIIKTRHAEEIKLLTIQNESHVNMIEETFKRREARLLEENTGLIKQSADRVSKLEDDRTQLISSHHNMLDQYSTEKAKQIEQLKQTHRQVLEQLRADHEDTVNRLKELKHHELEAVHSAGSHTRSIEAVLKQVSHNVSDLDNLHHEIRTQHHSVLDERNLSMTAKDVHLKAMQERLQKQESETVRERERLHSLVAKMEVQMTEQSRQLDDERWKLRQEQNKLAALQTSVEQERRFVQENIEREKQDLQRARDSVLVEQKSILSQLYEERRALAEERASVTALQKTVFDRQQKESVRSVQTEAELDGTMKSMSEERSRLTSMGDSLRKEREQISSEKLNLEQQIRNIAMDKEKVNHVATQLKERSEEIQDMTAKAIETQVSGERALEEASRIQVEHESRLDSIQHQLSALQIKERQLAKERLSTAKEKQELNNMKNRMICSNCNTPVKDLKPEIVSGGFSPGKTQESSPLASAMQLNRKTHQWQFNSEKDKDFLEDETMYLEMLKHSPYHKTDSPA